MSDSDAGSSFMGTFEQDLDLNMMGSNLEQTRQKVITKYLLGGSGRWHYW